ncbi:HNH endonuclease [Methylobacterium komagatae]|uniref:HNH endonuclease n=1 Tax=Methylobacterium komagatae TaxID=374425 RepID=A0ABW2BRW4_9HYPH
MPRLNSLKPRIATLDTRVGYGNATMGLTPDQAYGRVRRRESPVDRLYTSTRWRALRREQLTREPLCRLCMDEDGRAVSATVCDHVTPHRGDVQAFWAGPFQSLCAHHHNSAKQREENEALRSDGG